MRLLLAFVLMCRIASGGEIGIEKGGATDFDGDFEYISDKVFVDRSGNIEIRGRLKNISDVTYGLVMVTITAKDESGAVLARDSSNAKPLTIPPGSASHIALKLRPKEKKIKPSTIEWAVTNGRVRQERSG